MESDRFECDEIEYISNSNLDSALSHCCGWLLLIYLFRFGIIFLHIFRYCPWRMHTMHLNHFLLFFFFVVESVSAFHDFVLLCFSKTVTDEIVNSTLSSYNFLLFFFSSNLFGWNKCILLIDVQCTFAYQLLNV